MRFQAFNNNAWFKLKTATNAPETGSISALFSDRSSADAWIESESFSSGGYTRATITHKDMPDVFEIVYIIGMIDDPADSPPGTTTVGAIRGRESTRPVAWPADAVVECRVTAGMLADIADALQLSQYDEAIKIWRGENWVDVDQSGSLRMLKGTWAIGGIPAVAQTGNSDNQRMASSVEGVGYSSSVELGSAPTYSEYSYYYPGSLVKSTQAPIKTYCLSRGINFEDAPALGEPPWAEFVREADGRVFAICFANTDDSSLYFYPSEIGFICDSYSAMGTTVISVGSTESDGTIVSKTDLVDGMHMTAIDGPNQRFVLGDKFKKGVKGMYFTVTAPPTGGSIQGRFYWKGLFVSKNDGGNFPRNPDSADGRDESDLILV